MSEEHRECNIYLLQITIYIANRRMNLRAIFALWSAPILPRASSRKIAEEMFY